MNELEAMKRDISLAKIVAEQLRKKRKDKGPPGPIR